MPWNPSTQELWDEVTAALNQTEKHTAHALDIVRRYTGRWYQSSSGGASAGETSDEAWPENFPYAFISNILPALAIDNPQVKANAARVVGHREVAQAMTDGTNAWIKDVRYSDTLERVNADFCFCRGVLLHYLERDNRWSRGAVTPAVKRIPFPRFFQDSLAEEPDQDAFRGHKYHVNYDDLMNDPNVRDEAKARLSPESGEDSNGHPGGPQTVYPKPSPGELGRKRITCYSVWMRERNTIRVLAEGSETVELYEERPFYGPETGPYELLDCYPVPNQPWPLSPLVAVHDQTIDLNLHARAMGRAAARRRSIGLVEASDPDLGEKLADAKDGEFVPAKGLTGNYAAIELGGATDTQYNHTEYLRNRLDRVSGLTATVTGSVGEADTATEAQIADDALTGRVRFMKQKVIKGVQRSLEKIGWYLFHTEGIVIPVQRRDPMTGQPQEGLFFGGPTPTDENATWDDFQIEIVPYSMQKESPEAMQQRMMAFYQVFIQMMQMAPQMPWVRFSNIARDMAEAFDLGDKADEWWSPEVLGLMSQPPQAPASSAIGPGQQPSQQGQPSLQLSGGPGVPGGDTGGGQGQRPGQQMGQQMGPMGQGQPQGGLMGMSGGGPNTANTQGNVSGPRGRMGQVGGSQRNAG